MKLVIEIASWLAWRIGRRGRIILSRILGRLLYAIIPSRRRITLDNLRHAFPSLDRGAIVLIAQRCYANLVLVLFELLATPHLPPTTIHQTFRYHNRDCITNFLAKGRGVVLLSAHIGNWEWAALAAAIEFGQPVLVVVKHQRNHAFNQWLQEVRRSTGNHLVSMTQAARPMLDWLHRGGIVAILGDQAADPQSDPFVPLFGREASTYKAPAILARRTGAALVFAYGLRAADGIYDVHFEHIPEANDSTILIESVVARMNALLERAVERAPEQWVWQHNRWKYQPSDQTT
ncbi:MAG: lysophospholipid acyltransferase family protein [Chlorobi bacterium]|nr:lysophospholipid acyltransferase family protein [Chlorobiota bacterium]